MKFQVDAKSLKDLLSSGDPIFTVPHYQRPYRWDKEQVTNLWSDLTAALDDKETDYFIGSMVLTRDRERTLSIIDGQQRIATLTVLLAALRDHFEEQQNEVVASALHRLIIRTTLKGQEERIMVLREREDQYLKSQIQPRRAQRTSEIVPKKGPGRPRKIYIKQTCELFNKLLLEETATLRPRKKLDRLTEIAEFVCDGVTFITTIVGSDTDAYVVFETLNDRGLDLSIADLMKNYLFSLGSRGKRLDEMQGHWEQTSTYLEGWSFPRFLRHFWLSKHERVTERKLFERVKRHLQPRGIEKQLDFASDLASEARLYSSLIDPPAGSAHSSDLMDLRDMGIQQHLPLLLGAANVALPNREFGRVVGVCENLTVRYLIVADLEPNRLERKYSEWAIALRKGGAPAIDTIVREAASLCPEDDEFVKGFGNLTGLRTATARYLLRKINEHESGGRELKVAGPSEVHVEHILPQNPSAAWDPYIPKLRSARRELSERLGNLTLLAVKLNKEASNRLFTQKAADYYRKSQIEITRQLCNETNWDATTIDKRQERWAKIAPTIWSF